EILLRHPVEATVLDPGNPYVLAPHLCAAAAELALTEEDLDIFGPAARTVVDDLTRAGRLRRRAAGWYSMRRDAAAAAGLRGAGLAPIRVVEAATGRLVGTVDEPSAHLIVHEGAIYLHQGDSYLVATLDVDDRVALVEPCEPAYTTTARDVTEVEVRGELRRTTWGDAEIRFGDVRVTRQVVSFVRRRADTGAALGETPLDLPPRHLLTRAVWWTISADQADALGAAGVDLGGAAHAAEHASIGLLPLFATCDRWDIGGVSAARHPATGTLTVFVYDGHDGGAGFAERGFHAAADWLRATRQAIASCDCEAGCPSCVQSPKCGNANHPLSKRGAVALLDTLLAGSLGLSRRRWVTGVAGQATGVTEFLSEPQLSQAQLAASANRITTYAEGSEKGLSRDWLPCGSKFSLSKTPQRRRGSSLRHCPQTPAVYHLTPGVQPQSGRRATVHGRGNEPLVDGM